MFWISGGLSIGMIFSKNWKTQKSLKLRQRDTIMCFKSLHWIKHFTVRVIFYLHFTPVTSVTLLLVIMDIYSLQYCKLFQVGRKDYKIKERSQQKVKEICFFLYAHHVFYVYFVIIAGSGR